MNNSVEFIEFDDSVQFLNSQQVTHKLGISRTTIWRMVKAGDFPSPRQISKNRVAWLSNEINQWQMSRPKVAY